MTIDAHLLCAEFDIEIIPGTSYPLPGQTRAVATINRLIENTVKVTPVSSFPPWRKQRENRG